MDTHQSDSPYVLESTVHMAQFLASPDQARVSVRLSNGVKLLVPILQTSKVHELHRKILHRAVAFGVNASFEDTFLETTGRNQVALCGDDNLEDIWDWTQDASFVLRNLRDHVPASETTSLVPTFANDVVNEFTNIPPHMTRSGVCVRIFTLEDTVSSASLTSCRKDPLIVPDDITLSELHTTIAARLEQVRTTNGQSQIAPSKIELYLPQCRLNAEANIMTLRECKFTDDKTASLHVFVDLDYSDTSLQPETLRDIADISTLWGFPTTERGVNTFLTSLEIVFRNLRGKKHTLHSFMRSLLETTHFPPLLIAFKDLYDSRSDYAPNFRKVRMLAQAIHLLCLQMVPSWVCESSENALESSRQLFAWLYSLHPDSSLGENEKSSLPMLHPVHIRTADVDQAGFWYIALSYKYEVALSVTETNSSTTSKTITIELNDDNEALAKFLGRAIHGKSTSPTDYYFDSATNWSEIMHHDKICPPQPQDFKLLLHSTTNSMTLRTVSPDKLGRCTSRELPVITLGSTGQLSIYDQEYYNCGEQRFFTWNAIDGKEIMQDSNPGQYLMQQIASKLTERKRNGSWISDAWGDWTDRGDFGVPDEAVVICIDTSWSMSTSMPKIWMSPGADRRSDHLPSRLTEVKELFKNLASRISALQLSTYLGLVTFSSRYDVVVRQDLTPVHLDFEEQMDNVQAQNSTAIYDGIECARKMLSEIKKKFKNVKCRIVVLTDGQDNDSVSRPSSLATLMRKDDIVLDSVVIGTGGANSSELFKMSRSTGGYVFAPSSQKLFFQISLLETMVDLKARPDLVQHAVQDHEWCSFKPKQDDMPDSYHFPPSRPHPSQGDYFIALQDAERFLKRRKGPPADRAHPVHSSDTRSVSTAVSGTTLSSNSGTLRLILNEIREMVNNPHPYMDVYVSESNMGFWVIAMQGPPDSPYSKGTFKLYLELGLEFPLRPPSARFITPMLHPNITKHGRICHPILDREWTGTTRIYQVLQHMWGILVTLEARDAIDPLSTLTFWTNPKQGRAEVEQYVRHFASKSRAEIRKELHDNDTSSMISDCSMTTASTLAKHPKITTSTNSVASTPPPSYRSTLSANLRPAILTDLFTLRSNRSVAAGPPPLMSKVEQNSRDYSDEDSTIGSVTSSTSKDKSRRQSFFRMLKK